MLERMAGEDDDAALDEAVARGGAAWPQLRLPPGQFRAFLSERLRGEPADALSAADLYLACACLAGAPGAIEAFEQAYFPELRSALGRMGRSGAVELEEVAQALRARLFVGDRPKLREYSGRGALKNWFRVTAVRTALDQLPQPPPPLAGEVERLTASPELAEIRRMHQRDFNRALERALGALSPRQRNLLRYALLEELTLEELATVYRVHRATGAGWLADARAALLTGVRTQLKDALRVDSAELDSLLRLIRSDLHVSLPRLLPPQVEEER